MSPKVLWWRSATGVLSPRMRFRLRGSVLKNVCFIRQFLNEWVLSSYLTCEDTDLILLCLASVSYTPWGQRKEKAPSRPDANAVVFYFPAS